MMEGDSPELEIDSELVMSFYDQYQVLCQPGQTLFTDKSFRPMISPARSMELMASRPSMTPSPSCIPPSGHPPGLSHTILAPVRVSAVSQPPSSSLNPPMSPAPASTAGLTCPLSSLETMAPCPQAATWWAPVTPGTCLISSWAWTGSQHVTRHPRVPYPVTALTRALDRCTMPAPCPLTTFLLQPFLASHSPPWTYLITMTVTR